MRRRRFVQAVVAVPGASALVAQQQQQPLSPNPQPPPAGTETPKLETATPDAAAETVQRYFTAAQFAALRKLSEIILPPINGAPGAGEAQAPEFLDFLISQSPEATQQLYKAGLDTLNAQAKKRFTKPFADLDASQASELLAPLRQPWTYDPPSDPFARFLRAAKQDIRTATMNSREYTAAVAAGGRRGGAGLGLYWNLVE